MDKDPERPGVKELIDNSHVMRGAIVANRLFQTSAGRRFLTGTFLWAGLVLTFGDRPLATGDGGVLLICFAIGGGVGAVLWGSPRIFDWTYWRRSRPEFGVPVRPGSPTVLASRTGDAR